eukprot:CAMPEP_0119043424 /NCGR_PEP_ID=MMETSP1177-20130426/21728_1 /TAXON_ID=2985 /ORGANISM="Ochromonas sp, Strain CCMP1899" /LENGTH=394 /DNA_ID=CAMNT_0007011455 /DNA_START=173 /DNA_END=1358 /DNA_ORIENTATION=-
MSNFKNLEEATNQLLSAGWRWDPDSTWKVDLDCLNTDEEGYAYATDFGGGIDDTHWGVKGRTSFVRRRRMNRLKSFNPDLLFLDCESWTCDHADVEEVDQLSALLLNALVGNSIKRHPRLVSDPKLNIIKNSLMTALNLQGKPLGVTAIWVILEGFVNEGGGPFSVMSAAIGGTNPVEITAQRVAYLNSASFPLVERTALANAILHHHDSAYRYHCDKKNCGYDCVFRPMTCPNKGCQVIVSLKWGGRHDAVCPMKIVECDSQCGELMARGTVPNHMEHSCPLRPVLCPFSDIGCMGECTYKNLPDHLDLCTQSHLLLAASRMREQENVIRQMHSKIREICSAHDQQKLQLTALATASAASIAVEIENKKIMKHMKDDIARIDHKHTGGVPLTG